MKKALCGGMAMALVLLGSGGFARADATANDDARACAIYRSLKGLASAPSVADAPGAARADYTGVAASAGIFVLRAPLTTEQIAALAARTEARLEYVRSIGLPLSKQVGIEEVIQGNAQALRAGLKPAPEFVNVERRFFADAGKPIEADIAADDALFEETAEGAGAQLAGGALAVFGGAALALLLDEGRADASTLSERYERDPLLMARDGLSDDVACRQFIAGNAVLQTRLEMIESLALNGGQPYSVDPDASAKRVSGEAAAPVCASSTASGSRAAR